MVEPLFAIAAYKEPYTFGENAMPKGPDPTEKGDPEILEKTPVDTFTEYTETVFVPLFVTAAKVFPIIGVYATYLGEVPVENGDPLTVLKPPWLHTALRNGVYEPVLKQNANNISCFM